MRPDLRTLSRAAAALGIALGVGGCGIADRLGPKICTSEYRMGLLVEVRDARTGAPAAAGAIGVARAGTYEEVLQGPAAGDEGALVLYGLGERPGTYVVEVSRTGYEPWMAEGVRIRHDGCHVITVTLEARLEPLD